MRWVVYTILRDGRRDMEQQSHEHSHSRFCLRHGVWCEYRSGDGHLHITYRLQHDHRYQRYRPTSCPYRYFERVRGQYHNAERCHTRRYVEQQQYDGSHGVLRYSIGRFAGAGYYLLFHIIRMLCKRCCDSKPRSIAYYRAVVRMCRDNGYLFRPYSRRQLERRYDRYSHDQLIGSCYGGLHDRHYDDHVYNGFGLQHHLWHIGHAAAVDHYRNGKFVCGIDGHPG